MGDCMNRRCPNVAEIERLTAERDDYKDRWEQTGCTRHLTMEASIRLNERYRERIAELEAGRDALVQLWTKASMEVVGILDELAEIEAEKR